MSATRFSANAVFKEVATALQPCFKAISKSKPWVTRPLLAIKNTKLIWFTLCLYIYISYNSCNTHYAKVLSRNQKEQAIAAAKDSMTQAQMAMNTATQKTIYLTFDDGPNKGTANVVNSLNRTMQPAR